MLQLFFDTGVCYLSHMLICVALHDLWGEEGAVAAEKSRKGNEVCAAWRADANNTWLSVYAEAELLEHESILGKWLRCREGPLRLVERGGGGGERDSFVIRGGGTGSVTGGWGRGGGGESWGREQQIDPLSLGL